MPAFVGTCLSGEMGRKHLIIHVSVYHKLYTLIRFGLSNAIENCCPFLSFVIDLHQIYIFPFETMSFKNHYIWLSLLMTGGFVNKCHYIYRVLCLFMFILLYCLLTALENAWIIGH